MRDILSELSILETSPVLYSKLARTLFPVESTNYIKIQITHHRTELWGMDAFGREYQLWMLAEAGSQCSAKF